MVFGDKRDRRINPGYPLLHCSLRTRKVGDGVGWELDEEFVEKVSSLCIPAVAIYALLAV